MPDQNPLFPAFLKLENLRVLLVGGGNVGLEKLTAILRNSPETAVTVVSITMLAELRELAARHPRIRLMARAYTEADLDAHDIVFAATDDPSLHRTIVTAAHQRRLDLPGLQREVRDYEPRLALDGGADGFDPYRRMAARLRSLPSVPRIVAFEVGLGQARAVADLLAGIGLWPDIRIIRDYAGIERHVIASSP